MAINYMSNPANVLREYLKAEDLLTGPEAGYVYGQLAMALEIVTLIKTVERVPVVSAVARQELISALHTLLMDKGFGDTIYETYDRLCAWRRPTFLGEITVRVSDDVPPGVVSFVSLQPPRPIDESSSPDAEPPEVEPPSDSSHASSVERQSCDGVSIDGLWEWIDVGD